VTHAGERQVGGPATPGAGVLDVRSDGAGQTDRVAGSRVHAPPVLSDRDLRAGDAERGNVHVVNGPRIAPIIHRPHLEATAAQPHPLVSDGQRGIDHSFSAADAFAVSPVLASFTYAAGPLEVYLPSVDSFVFLSDEAGPPAHRNMFFESDTCDGRATPAYNVPHKMIVSSGDGLFYRLGGAYCEGCLYLSTAPQMGSATRGMLPFPWLVGSPSPSRISRSF